MAFKCNPQKQSCPPEPSEEVKPLKTEQKPHVAKHSEKNLERQIGKYWAGEVQKLQRQYTDFSCTAFLSDKKITILKDKKTALKIVQASLTPSDPKKTLKCTLKERDFGSTTPVTPSNQGSTLMHVYGKDDLLKKDATNFFDGLTGTTNLNTVYGVGSLRLGHQNSGTGEGTIGLGNLGTFGKENQSGYGRSTGGLEGRRAFPEIVPGKLELFPPQKKTEAKTTKPPTKK